MGISDGILTNVILITLLSSGRGQCLNNPPPDMEFDYLDEMPGQNHSPDTQCKWQYGPKSVMCKPHVSAVNSLIL